MIKGESFKVPIGFSQEIITFEWINPGRAMLGSSPLDVGHRSDESLFDCTFTQGFWMGNTLITQRQWHAVMNELQNNVSSLDNNLPIQNITWVGATSFCRKLQTLCADILPSDYIITLPTEAVWEYCCKAGTVSAHYSGNDENEFSQIAWYEKNSDSKPHPVGRKKPNAWNLFDMHGNLFEWCFDNYASYPTSPVQNWVQPRNSDVNGINFRVLRSSSYKTPFSSCRAANRIYMASIDDSPFFGFRVAILPLSWFS